MTPVLITWTAPWWLPYAFIVAGYIAPKVARLIVGRSDR